MIFSFRLYVCGLFHFLVSSQVLVVQLIPSNTNDSITSNMFWNKIFIVIGSCSMLYAQCSLVRFCLCRPNVTNVHIEFYDCPYFSCDSTLVSYVIIIITVTVSLYFILCVMCSMLNTHSVRSFASSYFVWAKTYKFLCLSIDLQPQHIPYKSKEYYVAKW